MINRLIAFSLEQRLVVLALTVILVGWGIVAFQRTPTVIAA